MLRDSTPRYVGPLVSRLVGLSVPFLLFWRFSAFWAYGSFPDALVTFSSTAPTHPHATRVAMYPALLNISVLKNLIAYYLEHKNIAKIRISYVINIEFLKKYPYYAKLIVLLP